MSLSNTNWNSATSQNVTITGGTIEQTGTPTRVVSTNNPTSNTVTIANSSWTPSPTADGCAYGFTTNATPVDHDDCVFGFNFYNGFVYVNENGYLGHYNEAFNGAYTYKVVVTSGTVYYYFNNVLKYTSTNTFDYTNTYYIYAAKGGSQEYTFTSQDTMSSTPPSTTTTFYPPPPAYITL